MAVVPHLRLSARILSRAATVKTKKLATSGILKRKKPATSGMLKRKKPASASSEGAGIPEGAGKIIEPRELLKLKRAAFEAKDLWDERRDPGALERWIQAEKEAKAAEEAAEPPKKRKKLVFRRLSDRLIIVMKTQPYLRKHIPDEELESLNSRSYGFAEIYRMRKFIDDKMYAYEQALINQHDILGYAEDVSESELTDDEQEQ